MCKIFGNFSAMPNISTETDIFTYVFQSYLIFLKKLCAIKKKILLKFVCTVI